jgi:hypothetical protein
MKPSTDSSNIQHPTSNNMTADGILTEESIASSPVFFCSCVCGAGESYVMCDRGATVTAPAMNHESLHLQAPRIIRQIDADILEKGVEEKWGAALADFDDEGRRLSASESMTASSSYDNLLLPAIIEHASWLVPHPAAGGSRTLNHYRNIVESFPPPTDLSENDDYFLDSYSLTSPSKPIEEIDHEALLRRISSGRVSNRSDSFDRRMNESAQFAEAVGEEPDSLLLKKIVEDDSSSDFDDNEIDNEIDEDGTQLMDYGAVPDKNIPEEDCSAAEEEMGGYTSNKIEPTCVSADVTQMALNEEECSHQEHPLLPTTTEDEIACSTPQTPAPSPCIPNVHRHPLTSSTPPYVNWTFTRQYSSALNSEGNNSHSRSLSFPSNEADFVYRGIRSNPPEITIKGVARGNYAQMHRKAWLEVSDKRHRYGKNLRMYYKHWEELGHPFHMFFDWLDSKGEAIGNPLPSLSEIPRPVLDSDTVRYITDPEITASYALDIVANHGDGSANILLNGHPVSTGEEGWIFVLRDNVFYGSQKVTAPKSLASGGASNGSPSTGIVVPRQRFHHSTFFGGKAVASAGIFLTDERGLLTQLWPHSGHYRPGEAHMQRVLFFLHQLGVELITFMVDMQQIFKVTRELSHKGGNTGRGDKVQGDGDKDKENHTANGKNSNDTHAKKSKKMAKVGSLHLLSGQEVALFLAHKALLIEKGVFQQIHKIRRIPKASRNCVHFVLNYVNS